MLIVAKCPTCGGNCIFDKDNLQKFTGDQEFYCPKCDSHWEPEEVIFELPKQNQKDNKENRK